MDLWGEDSLISVTPGENSTLNWSGVMNGSDTPVREMGYYRNSCLYAYNPTDNIITFQFWICGIVLNIVGVLGILGNVLSMVILSRPQMRSSINYLLIGLARCDIVLIITSVLLFGIPSIYPYTGYLFFYHYYIYPKISPYVFPIAMVAQTASIYLTFTVTLERFVAVCHPLQVRALCTYGRAKLYVAVCIIFALLYNLPRFFEVSVDEHIFRGGVVYCVTASEMRSDSYYIEIYIHWLYLIFIYVLPFSQLAILNSLIYAQVRRANRERQRLSRTEKREIGLATMLICVVIVFFLCNVLAMINNIMEAFYDKTNDYLVNTSNLLVTINSSVNFIIYVIFGEKFKRIFLTLFCKGRIGRESPDGLIHDDSSFSNGDGNHRNSGRFQRHGTTRSSTRSNGTSLRITRSVRVRAPSPGPCVYYPARDFKTRGSLVTRSVSVQNSDWDRDTVVNGNGLVSTTGF
ncbi:FMRFamide receptor-like [Phlebotomus papatasi]|uniref:G-protein coupled receptors family 1 profile domain-containing protein n=1 Tax=Phlebotomus papatasi TaxID=29031 RepID=A0A1B0D359_PHLPP|nr:FMRFamide receptor-like [Phlebotomus papatasi]